MDIRYYFDEVNFSACHDSGYINWKYSLGSVIEKNSKALTKENIHRLNIAIVGAPFDSRKEDTYSTEAADKIRAQLYKLSAFNSKINIADFGNLKPAGSVKGNFQALRDIAEYFNELNIVTVVIGGSQDLSVGICEAFARNPFFSFTTVDAYLDIKKAKEPFSSSNYLSRLFSYQPQIFQFNIIGFQTHYLPPGYLDRLKTVSEHIRLGTLRDNISLAEPVFRNTDFLSFDITSLKYAEAPGGSKINPNGLRSEEACQLAKYAGLSNRIKIFGLFEVEPANGPNDLTVAIAAQIIWYFVEGFINRGSQPPDAAQNNIKYQVEVDNIDNPIVFYKNTITSQWWMEIETTEKTKLNIACSEKEYIQASGNEIPELWLKYLQKIDRRLK
ncbi:MAG: arginase family [Prolixibacteraceae bacterium]|nr:MAG: arginase family [Prolixibacteraceae bacterium]